MTYNPHQTGNPQGRVGYSTSYGNTSHFRLANHSSRYWYFRWYQRWETGIDWGGSCQNKTFYLNYVGMGDFTFTVQRNCSNCFLIKSVPNGSGTQIVDYANHSGGNLDDEEWHKLELYIDVGTTGGGNGRYIVWVDDVQLRDRSNITFNNTIRSNPMDHLTGWPSNTSGECSGSGQTWLDDFEIYTLSGLNDIPGAGSGDVDPDPVVDARPTITITQPTSGTTYSSTESSINIDGTASDDIGVSRVTWANSRGGSGTAIGTTAWNVYNISLMEGTSIITLTAIDSSGQTRTDTLTVNYSSGDVDDDGDGYSENQGDCNDSSASIHPDATEICGDGIDQDCSGGDLACGDTVRTWSAEEQTGQTSWSNSTATWCVRVLLEGSSVQQSGSAITLGFKGRTSGNYNIKKVSIAERDTSGSEGDVVDSTWTRVTFDGQSTSTWGTYEATISAGTEKLSDVIPFSIQSGRDYYVTFQQVSPTTYLRPSSTYSELYFDGSDHADDIDWSGNGHSIYDGVLHTLSNIYITSDGNAPGIPSIIDISVNPN